MTVNVHSAPARSTRLALSLIAAAALAACSASSDSGAEVAASSVTQNLLVDPDGQTVTATLTGLGGALAAASVEASGGQVATGVSMSGDTAVITFDGAVTPDDQVRFVDVEGLGGQWRAVETTDARDPLFAITDATQDTSDLLLGGDTVTVRFYNGPRVLPADVEDLASWTLAVDGTGLDLTGSTVTFDAGTQTAVLTLGRLANLHSNFTLSVEAGTVASSSVHGGTLTGTATGDAGPPALDGGTPVRQLLDPAASGDEFGRVVLLDFDEPISPLFGPVASNISVVDHLEAQGTTVPTAVELVAGDDTQVRVTFSRPVVPGLDELSLDGILDAHGNAIVPVTSAVSAASTEVNGFASVELVTVEGLGNDRVVATTLQALDPDTAANDDRWTLVIGGAPAIDLSTQRIVYDLFSRTLTIQLDFDVENGTTGDLTADGAVDVDGQLFSGPGPQALAAGDAVDPAVSSVIQNRVADGSGRTLDVVFSEDVDAASAADTSNYTVTPGLTVTSATQLAGNVVRLETDAVALPGDHTVTVAQAVSDPAGNDLGAAYGPAAFASSDTVAPRSVAVSGTAVEGGSNDRITVLFDDDMVPAEVEDAANWTVESPVGTPVDVAAATISYSPSAGSATVTLDGVAATSLVRMDDLTVRFSTMRDLGGNVVVADASTATVLGELNRPALEAAFIAAGGAGDELVLRFSEPMRRLTDLFDAVTRPDGVRYSLLGPGAGAPVAPISAAEVDGGLGVSLTFGAAIDPAATLDVVGLVDLAGNVLFPVQGAALDAEAVTEPSLASTTVTAIPGARNDELEVVFGEPMSTWGITSPESYSLAIAGGADLSAELDDAQLAFDGVDTLTVTFGPGSTFDLDAGTSYEVGLAVSGTTPLRTRFGVPLSAPAGSGPLAVAGDNAAGPDPAACAAVLDPLSAERAYVVFDESVDQAAAEVPAAYDLGGTVASAVTLVDPRVVQVTFSGATVGVGQVLTVAGTVVDTAGNAPTGALALSVTEDVSAPTVSSVSATIAQGVGGDLIEVSFSEAVDPVTAAAAASYSIASASGEVRLLAVLHDSGTDTVRLLVEDLVETAVVTVTVEGVRDVVGNELAGPVAVPTVPSGDITVPSIDVAVANLWADPTGRTVDVRFSEDIDYTFAATASRWSTSGAASVAGVQVIDFDHVRLALSEPLGAAETLSLEAGLADRAGNAAAQLTVDPVD